MTLVCLSRIICYSLKAYAFKS